jgi:hypothetical protein
MKTRRSKLAVHIARSQQLRSQIGRYVVLAFAILGYPFDRCFPSETVTEAQPVPDLVVVAKLVAIEPAHGCGMFYFAEVAEYTDITVLRGAWSSERLRVVHGCTEIPRSQYAWGAGTLERFTVGDDHRLELTVHDIYKTGRRLKPEDNASVADYYALRVDLAQVPNASAGRGGRGRRSEATGRVGRPVPMNPAGKAGALSVGCEAEIPGDGDRALGADSDSNKCQGIGESQRRIRRFRASSGLPSSQNRRLQRPSLPKSGMNLPADGRLLGSRVCALRELPLRGYGNCAGLFSRYHPWRCGSLSGLWQSEKRNCFWRR